MTPNYEKPCEEFISLLLTAMLDDVAAICTYHNEDRWDDGRVILRRITCEGLDFVTKTLPSLGKALDKALASGDPFLCPPGFKTRKDSTIPRLFGTLFEQVFDDYGYERSDASVQAVSGLRQLTMIAYKLELPTTEQQINDTIQKFVQTDRELAETPFAVYLAGPEKGTPTDRKMQRVLQRARRLIARVLSLSDPHDDSFRPKHGPGAVATGEKREEKMQFKRYYRRLADQFPYDKYFYFNVSHLCDELQDYLALEEIDSGTAKVVLVPKDSRGPRLISCEPLEYQWIQQMLMANMVNTIEGSEITRGLVNFTDQTVNRTWALRSSCGDIPQVTLDMKDASDRVSVELVRALYPDTWFQAIMAARSSATKLPGGEIVQLRKFAPMGSATCFPVEALCFWALATAAIQNRYEEASGQTHSWMGTLSWTSVYPTKRAEDDHRVFVYGDDIILHRDDHSFVEHTYSYFGLKLNQDKCCTGRFFRESCGCDAYKGVDVTPLKLKAVWSSQLMASNSLLTFVAFHNALVRKGWANSARYVKDKILERISIPCLPVDLSKENQDWHGAVCLFVSENEPTTDVRTLRRRYNPRLQKWQYKTWVAQSRVVTRGTPGWGEMLRKASHRSADNKADSLACAGGNPRRPLAPGGDKDLLHWSTHIFPLAKVCQYTSAREVTLQRVWVG